MTTIITRSAVRATKAPARKNAAPQATPPQHFAKPIAWRQPIRQALEDIYGSLAELVDPVGKPGPLGLAAGLMSHAKAGIGALLCQEDDGPGWCDQTRTLGEVLWARDSLVAAARLVEFKVETLPAPVASSLLPLRDRMSAVCVALDGLDLPSLMAKLASAGAMQSRDQKAVPISPVPRFDMEAFADEAERINLLLEWVIKAKGVLNALQLNAEMDRDFYAVLQEKRIAINDADWQGCRMSEGLSDMLTRQSILIKKMAGSEA
ncbi:MAG: hypothetical protein QM740_17940 [Acidovorax sp.]